MNRKALFNRVNILKTRWDDRHAVDVIFVSRPTELDGLFMVNGEAMEAEKVTDYLNKEQFSKAIVIANNLSGDDDVYWSLDEGNIIIFSTICQPFF